MSHYLKKILFTLLIFMMPYMNSLSMAMDDGDHERSFVRAHQVRLVTDDRQDVSSSVKQSTSSQIESLGDSQNSWTSYLISPAKIAIQGAYDVVEFVIQKPKIATLIGLSYMVSVAAAANCTGCYQCTCVCYRSGIGPQTYGKVPDVNSCINVCRALQYSTFKDCY